MPGITRSQGGWLTRASFVLVGCGLAVTAICLSVTGFVATGERVTNASEPEGLLVVYMGENQTGRSLTVTSSLPDLPVLTDENGDEFDWNDQIVSIEVRKGVWRLYEHGRFNTELDDTPIEDWVRSNRESVDGWSCVVFPPASGSPAYGTENGPLRRRLISSIEMLSEVE